jgi:hypothetical protein
MHNEPTQSVELRVFDLLKSGTLVHKAASRHAEVAAFRVRTAQGDFLVAVKHILLNGQRAKESIQSEFRTLQELQNVLGDSLRKTVPRPLLLLENEGTIFFSFVPGTSLNAMLRRDANALTAWFNVMGRKRLEACGGRIGEWLKRFHDATVAPDQTFDHERFCLQLESLMAKCEPLGLPSSALAAVRGAAFTLSATWSGCAIPAAATHGDFLPQNVLLDGGQPGVIDFASYASSGPVYTDLATFAGYLMILARKPSYSRRAIESVVRQFLLGYSAALNDSILRLYMVRAVLRITTDGTPQRASRSTETMLDLLSSILNNKVGLLSL